VANWKKVMTKKLDPIQAMMTGQLKLKGNMAIIMKSVRAAKELVESCTRIPTEFPI
jgi:putative sterol carrier protein